MVRLTDRASGQLPLGGQPGGDRHPALEDQQPDAVGERAVGGRPAGAGARRAVLLGAEQPGELSRAHRRSPLRHGNQSTFLGLAMDGCHSKPQSGMRRSTATTRGHALVHRRAVPRERVSRGGWSSCTPAWRCTARARRCWSRRPRPRPWDVLHQGLAERTGLTIGVVSIIVGAVVLLLWIPLRQRPGLGTVSNVFVVGLAMDAHAGRWSPTRTRLAVRDPAAGRRASCSTAWRPASTSPPGSARGRATA